MDTAHVIINGQAIDAPFGSTILQAARLANIDIPTLCSHPALRPAGSCRICVVEVKGQRVLQTACTFPISEGMDVQTESPRVVAARKLVVDLLFSERNHYCPYCEMSGSCELQSLGYRYGLNHWVYPTYLHPFPIDASHKYLLMEHNRCILCGRCYRACSELVANHTLGLRQRGAKSMVHADMGVPWGESTCIACGTCAQICPTGTLTDKRSSFMGRTAQVQFVESSCTHCSLGCGMKIVTRNDSVLRLESDWDVPVSSGLLCEKGRFAPLNDARERLMRPLVRKNGRLDPVGWEEAVQTVTERLGSRPGDAVGLLTTTALTDEALYLAGRIFRDTLATANTGLLNEASCKAALPRGGFLADLLTCDVVVMAGADPAKEQPVASFLVKRNVDDGGRLILVGDEQNGLAPFASMIFGMDQIGQAVAIAERAENPIVIYGTGLDETAVKALQGLEKKAAFIALEPGVNTGTAKASGLDGLFRPADAEVLYVLLGEQNGDGPDPIGRIGKETFVIAQACYTSEVTERADVVLPMAIWSERAGSFTNTEGRKLSLNQAVPSVGEAKADWEILALVAAKLGLRIGPTLTEVAAVLQK